MVQPTSMPGLPVGSEFKRPEQEQLLNLVCKGVSIRKASIEMGMAYSTLCRWSNQPVFVEAFRRRMTSSMAALLPQALDQIHERFKEGKSGLLPLVKSAEFLADRVGLAPMVQAEAAPALAVQINLGEPTPAIDPEKETMKAELAQLRAEMVELRSCA